MKTVVNYYPAGR